MSNYFPIIQVPDDPEAIEPMGSKPKFWYRDKDGTRWLFKESRKNSGEDWSEKLSCEIAQSLGLPCAQYELAEWKGKLGTVSKSFVPTEGRLVPGNEILSKVIPVYPADRLRTRVHQRVPLHTLTNIFIVIESDLLRLPIDYISPKDIGTPSQLFIGYLLLDALIGNTDRHHENWGLVAIYAPDDVDKVHIHLAPTFDHASCLGRELMDADRLQRLTTRDKGYSIEAFLAKAKSAIYETPLDTQPLHPLDVFRLAAKSYPEAGRVWLKHLQQVTIEDYCEIMARIPEDRMSKAARDFAFRMLEINRGYLLESETKL